MSALLAARGLVKGFAGRPLLDIDTLVLEEASAYVLTGVNGSGKSTLLRVLAGLEPASCSALSWRGSAISLSPYADVLRASIVYVHQHPIMFSTTVLQNIAFGLLARGVPRAQALKHAEIALEWAGLGQVVDSDPATLSGGEKQRVALARAKVMNPHLLLLDEPTANLDGPAREQVIALIPALLSAGSTVVMACHDRDLIGLPGIQRLKLRDTHLEIK